MITILTLDSNEIETYDAVIASGTFAPGHLYSDAFLDLIRMTKKGKLFHPTFFFKNENKSIIQNEIICYQ